MNGQPQELSATVIAELTKGNKISAIRILRQERGLDLRDAKDAVEAYIASRPELASQFRGARIGAIRLTLMFLVLIAVIFIFYTYLHGY